MTEVVENVNTADTPRRLGLISTIFRCYRKNFGLFWRIMLPMIIFNFLFNIAENFSESYVTPENLWLFDTASGLSVSDSPKSTGVDWGMIFGFHAFNIGFLWLAMCPLIFAIVERRRNVEVTSRSAWRRVRSHAGAILRAFFLLYFLGALALLGFLILTLKIFPDVPDSPFGSSLCLGLFLIVGVLIYWSVNWSLYNQSIIIEDHTSAAASFRRSSELLRGVWGQAFGMCLLLALVTMVMTSMILGIALLLFSFTVPEFAPLREVLLSVKFLTLFVGGYARISFESAPSFWTVGIMVLMNILANAVMAPVWAILTTQLYRERIAITD